jgi:alpha-glucosidase (family GH31 glycosyl hydrolase)
MSRYRLLPYWYTLFRTAATVGMPPMRPLWVHYPADTNTYTMEDQVGGVVINLLNVLIV